jgi:hypothetical protein
VLTLVAAAVAAAAGALQRASLVADDTAGACREGLVAAGEARQVRLSIEAPCLPRTRVCRRCRHPRRLNHMLGLVAAGGVARQVARRQAFATLFVDMVRELQVRAILMVPT